MPANYALHIVDTAGYSTETLVLAALAANVWTPFPAPATVTAFSEYEIYRDTGERITHSLEVRRNAGVLEARSLLALANVQFEYTGT